MSDGSVRLEARQAPINYIDPQTGSLREIDTTLIDNTDEFNTASTEYYLSIDKYTPSHTVSLSDGRSVSLRLLGNAKSLLGINNNECSWDMGDGVTYRIQPLNIGCGTILELENDLSPKKWQWQATGNTELIRSIVGKDANGSRCDLIVNITSNSIIDVEFTGFVQEKQGLRNLIEVPAVYPVYIDPTITRYSCAAADNCKSGYYRNGAVISSYVNSDFSLDYLVGDHAYAYYYYTAYPFRRIYWAGIRFQTVSVPNAAAISCATLTYINLNSTTGLPTTGSTFFFIYGNSTDSAPAFSAASSVSRMRNIVKTSTKGFSVTHSSVLQQSISINITGVVQELVNRAGWSSNNNMSFVWFPRSTNFGAYGPVGELWIPGGLSTVGISSISPTLTITYNTSLDFTPSPMGSYEYPHKYRLNEILGY